MDADPAEPAAAGTGAGAKASSGAREAMARAARAAVRLSPLGQRVHWSLPPDCQAVILTFDDGPEPEWTPRVLDCLMEHGATATFFLIGGKASERPELIRRARAEGHTVGSHTFGHRNLRELPPAKARREIADGDAAVATATGERPRWFRPPFGAFTPVGLWHTRQAGSGTVLWNVDPRDYRARSAGQILRQLGPLNAGDIVLLHDTAAATVEALPEILARVADAGLQALSLDAAVQALAKR